MYGLMVTLYFKQMSLSQKPLYKKRVSNARKYSSVLGTNRENAKVNLHYIETRRFQPLAMNCVCWFFVLYAFVLTPQSDARSIGVEFEWVEEMKVCIVYFI